MEHEHIDDLDTAFAPKRTKDRRPTPDASEPWIGVQAGNRAAATALGRVDRAGKSQGAGPLDPEIGDEITSARSGGTALDDGTRADMEGHLGTDLSAVRVHADTRADQLSRSVQAEAFTTGTDVFFKSGSYQPGTSDGRRLLAHELTHVVQQTSGETDGAGRVSHPDDAHEVEARAVGDSVASSAPADPAVAREELDEEEEVATSPDPTVAREELDEEEEMM